MLNLPENYEQLKLNVFKAVKDGLIYGSTVDFAESLITQADKKKKLSEKQLKWLKALASYADEPESKFVDVPTLYMRVLHELMLHPKKSKIVLWDDGKFVLAASFATKASKTPGVLQLTDGQKFPDNAYYGKIRQDGRYLPSPAMIDEPDSVTAKVVNALKLADEATDAYAE